MNHSIFRNNNYTKHFGLRNAKEKEGRQTIFTKASKWEARDEDRNPFCGNGKTQKKKRKKENKKKRANRSELKMCVGST